MTTAELVLVNRLGLHARAAATLVAAASGFSSRISLYQEGREADAKSIMAVMLLGARCGARIRVEAQGEDEELAVEAIRTLVANRFGEEE